MDVSYNKLWKLLIDKNLKRTEFAKECGIGQNTLAKLGKNEHVSMDVLIKICRFLDCDFGDVVELVKGE